MRGSRSGAGKHKRLEHAIAARGSPHLALSRRLDVLARSFAVEVVAYRVIRQRLEQDHPGRPPRTPKTWVPGAPPPHRPRFFSPLTHTPT